ncbi:MAG: acyl-CoA dehydrogenase family protein, partial [Persicimonas sp.]
MSHHHQSLTELSEDEQIFREAVAGFADKAIAPLVEEMDRKQKLDQSLIDQCFEMGLMGIEVPAEYGGSESSFFTAILAVEELAKVDPSMSVFVDVQNTLVNNAILR